MCVAKCVPPLDTDGIVVKRTRSAPVKRIVARFNSILLFEAHRHGGRLTHYRGIQAASCDTSVCRSTDQNSGSLPSDRPSSSTSQ